MCCGQHYCDTCLKEWLSSKTQNTCPHCREENFQSFPNKEKIREVKEFKIRCVHKEKGCGWVGEMDALKDHLSKNCGCVKVKCKQSAHKVLLTLGWRATSTSSVASMCGTAMERRHLTRHQENECLYRQYTCQYCGYIDTYDAIAGSGKKRNEGSMIMYGGNHYDRMCIEYPLKCPNECGAENIKRKDMTTHLENCPLEPIKCPFSEVCNKYFRKNIEDHKKECDFRPYQCEHCGHNATYLSMSGKGKFWTLPPGHNHYDQCEQYPLQCPNKCGAENIKRKEMKTHRETCPLELLDCPFQHAGCPVGKILHKDMDTHCKDNMQTHLLLVVQSNKELSHKNEEFEKRIQVLEARLD